MPESPWCQVTIGFPDWTCAENTAVTHLYPLLAAAETGGLIEAWFYVRKQPCWRIRYLPTGDPPTAHRHLYARLAELQQQGHITRAVTVVYEPETHAFGGPEAMTSAHRLWHLDSRHLLGYLAATMREPAVRRRHELAILLASTMLRGAGLDWYEQGDVWARVAAHRDPPDNLGADQRRTLLAQVGRLMSVDTNALVDSGPLANTPGWTAAYETAGRELAHLNAEARLRRGLRDVLAHQVIFAANRLGVRAITQAALANTATAVVFGDAPAANAATDHTHEKTGTRSTTIVNAPGRQW